MMSNVAISGRVLTTTELEVLCVAVAEGQRLRGKWLQAFHCYPESTAAAAAHRKTLNGLMRDGILQAVGLEVADDPGATRFRTK